MEQIKNYIKYNSIDDLPIYLKPTHKILEMIKDNKISSNELVDIIYQRIKKYNDLNAFLNIIDQNNQNNATKINKNKKLNGIPIAIKDNIVTKDIVTTAGSKILENYKPMYDATVVTKLKEEGAVIIGKTNMDEFAMGSSNENSAFGIVKNPWNPEFVPGGSSGGSAVAVTLGLSYISLGSDTGGSIRQPASYCGVCGMKPSYGLVSRYGLISYASSLDQIGPFTRDVLDMALTLDIISGYDIKDSTSVNHNKSFFDEVINTKKDEILKLKIGIINECFENLDNKISNHFNEIINFLKKLGIQIYNVSFPLLKYLIPTYYLIAMAEASSNLARYDGVKYGSRVNEYNNLNEMYMKTRDLFLGNEVKRRIILGTYVLSAGYYDAYYKTAQNVRIKICQEYEKLFENIDVLLLPTTPNIAFKLGEKINDPLSMYLSDIFTVMANLTYSPAISIPCGLIDNMPIGLQFMTKYLNDDIILKLAYLFQQQTDYHLYYPNL